MKHGIDVKNIRKYGGEPFRAAVIHGGPGAPGEMAPVACELSSVCGVLEPLQTAGTIEGQVRELKTVLEKYGSLPVTLIGHSWGAWLSFIFTARYPSLVSKLVLIASGPFADKYTVDMMATRLERLGEGERKEVLSLQERLENSAFEDKNAAMTRFGELLAYADSFDPLPHDSETLECRYDIYQNVWEQASELRSSGMLLALGKEIKCPVVAIHGDYDPHPAEGVREPLTGIVRDFRFIRLEKCGHYPWWERSARERFYDILKSEVHQEVTDTALKRLRKG